MDKNNMPAAKHCVWSKSSRSATETACVEVAAVCAPGRVTPVAVAVRDSKAARGPVLVLGPPAWAAFVAAVRSGALDTIA